MSVYSVRGKGWRYDFTLKGERHSKAWFKTKRAAMKAEADKRREVEDGKDQPQASPMPTDMGFLELVNRRLDYLQLYRSQKYYRDHTHRAKRWARKWGHLMASEVTGDMIDQFILKRAKVSNNTANVEIRYLRAMFNFAKRKKWLKCDPTEAVEFLPVEKKIKYVPPMEDIDGVIAAADEDTQDYLWAIRETMARVGEINQLQWEDVDLENGTVTLYTRKKKGGNRLGRKVHMTGKLREILSRRFAGRDLSMPWVFWHSFTCRKTGATVRGPYKDRKALMKGLCKRAGVRYFRYHALRHAGASLLDRHNVPLGAIQRILGHENRSTTEIYLHSMGKAEKEAMSVFEQARRKKSHTDSHTGPGQVVSLENRKAASS